MLDVDTQSRLPAQKMEDEIACFEYVWPSCHRRAGRAMKDAVDAFSEGA